MKTRILILFAFFTAACFAMRTGGFSQSTNVPAVEMSQYEKMNIYSKLQYSYFEPLTFSATVGLGLGSFSQKDWLGGIIGMAADIASIALYFGSLTIPTFPLGHADHIQNLTFKNILFNSSIALFGASRIFQIVKPVLYAEEKNNELMMKLGISIQL